MKANRTKTILRRVLVLALAVVCIVPMELITPSAFGVEQKKLNDELNFKLITRADKGYNNYSTNAAYWTYQNEYLAAVSDPGQESIRNATPNSDSWADGVTHNYGWDEGAVTAGNLFWCSMCKGANLSSYGYLSNPNLLAKRNQDYHERMIQNFNITYGLIHLTSAKVEKTGSGQITWMNYDYPNNNKATYKYPCVGACMPFVLEVTVPANSYYEVEYAFDLSTYSYSGEYAVAVLDGDCNKKCTNTTTYASGDILSSSHSLKYLAMDENLDAILSVEDDYYQTVAELKKDVANSKITGEKVTPLAERPGGVEGGDLKDTAYKTFLFKNDTDKAQNYTRAFALIITHQAAYDINNLKDRNANSVLSHYIRGTLDVSVNSIKKASDSVELRTPTTGSDYTAWALETGNGAGTELSSLQYSAAAGDYLRVGDSVNISDAYEKIDTDFFNKASERYGSYDRLSCETYMYSKSNYATSVHLNDWESSTTQRTIIIPAKLSMEVKARESVYATFKMELEAHNMFNGYTVSLMQLGDDVDSAVSTVSPSFSGKEMLIYGGKSPGTIGSISSVLSDDILSYAPEVILEADRIEIENKSGTFYTSYAFNNSKSENSRTFERYLLLVITSNRYFTDELQKTYPITSYPDLYEQRGEVLLATGLAETRKLDLSTKVGADDTEESVGGNTIKWSKMDRDEFTSILKSVSDCDYHTATGWERLLITLSGDKNNTFTGQLTNTGTGTVQNDSIHPLGDYLKYAWLYNGAYSYPGAVGSDYLVTEADISTQPLQNCDNFYWDQMVKSSCTTTADLDAWYIKYAGEVSGNPAYYLAMEGVDGKRYLLVSRFDVVGTGNPEMQMMFVTAAEYDAHPELFATAYGWPTGTEGAKALKSGDENIHTYKGLWQDGVNANGDCNITADGLLEEAFREGISGNLQWRINYNENTEGQNTIHNFYNTLRIDAASRKDCSLYQYYQSVDRNSDNEDIKRFLEYEPEMKNCLDKMSYKTMSSSLGVYTPNESDMSTVHLGKYDKSCDLDIYLGIYEDASQTKKINVGEGETLVVDGSMHIQKGQRLTVSEGGTLQVKGTLINDGEIFCYGTIRIESGGCIRDDTDNPQGYYCLKGGTLIIGTDGIFHPGYVWNSYVKIDHSTVYNDGLLIAPAGLRISAADIENGSNGVIVVSGDLKRSLSTNSARDLAEAMPRGALNASYTKTRDDDEMVKLARDTLVSYGKAKLTLDLNTQKDVLENRCSVSDYYTQARFSGKNILHNDGVIYYFGGYCNAGELVAYGTGTYYNLCSVATQYTTDENYCILWDFPKYQFLYKWGADNSNNTWYVNTSNESRKLLALLNASVYYDMGIDSVKSTHSANMVDAFGGDQTAYAKWVAAFDAELNGN